MYARSQGNNSPAAAPIPVRQGIVPAASGVFVRRLSLSNFRNYPFLQLHLPEMPGPVVLTGRNGAGKTNLMEAVSFLAPGKGLRQARFFDILPQKESLNRPAWAVAAVVHKGDEEIDLGTEYESVDGRRSEKRRIRINGAPVSGQAELGRICSAVWLTPAMDRLFSGEPAGRRRFWDRLTQAFFPKHASHCAAYSQSLRQWGSLLREGTKDGDWLAALERTMGKYGAQIAASRRAVLGYLSDFLDRSLTSFPHARLSLSGGMEEELSALSAEQAQTFIAEQFARSRGVCAQSGSAGGIHTADLNAFHREKEMNAAACSTGEQKALLISVLLAHIRAQAVQTGALPLVLFDEVTAHLDARRRDALFEEIAGLKTQVWMTGTDRQVFEGLNQTAHFIAVDELLRNKPEWAAAS